MDDRRPSILPDELRLQSAPDRISDDVDSPPAELTKSGRRVAPGRRRQSDQSGLCGNDLPDGPSVVVYCGNEEEVSRGFLIALRAMGVVAIEQLPEPAKPPFTRAKP